MRKLRIPLIAVGVIAGAGLAACHHAPTSTSSSPAIQAGIVASAGRLVLPAVPGNPGAGYFTLVNQGPAAATIVSVAIDGAGSAEMHQTSGSTMQPLPALPIRAGGSVIFAPGGKHVMAFSLAPRLVPGGSTEMTLTFVDGSKLSAPLKIEAAGTDDTGMDDMPGMKM